MTDLSPIYSEVPTGTPVWTTAEIIDPTGDNPYRIPPGTRGEVIEPLGEMEPGQVTVDFGPDSISTILDPGEWVVSPPSARPAWVPLSGGPVERGGPGAVRDIQWWTDDGQPRIWAIFEAERTYEQQNGGSDA